MATFHIRGTRGNRPVTGTAVVRFGGDTTCYSVDTDDGQLIIDAGTGITHTIPFPDEPRGHASITLLFTHFHLDHVIGLPMYAPLYHKGNDVRIMARPRPGQDWRATLRTVMGRPLWPVGLDDAGARIAYDDLCTETLQIANLRIQAFEVPHPQGCLAFRLELPALSIVVATDTEYASDAIDPAFVDFCRGADALIMDAQFTEGEYARHRGWGHSSWLTATTVANRAAVGRLLLTHHAPKHTDADIDTLLAAARRQFARTEAASTNMAVEG